MTWRFVSVDSETGLIAPGVLAPPLVCVSYDEGRTSGLLNAAPGLDYVERLLRDPTCVIIGARIAYDMGVFANERPELLPLIWEAYEQGRISDTHVREKLIDIAKGSYGFTRTNGVYKPFKYSLESYAERRLGVKLDKGEDGWRLRYIELKDTPVSQWPERAARYAQDDAISTRNVWKLQQREAGGGFEEDGTCGTGIVGELEEVRNDWALHLSALWGLRADPDAVRALGHRLDAELLQGCAALAHTGLVGSDGSLKTKVMAEAVAAAYRAKGEQPPETDKGGVSTSEEALRLSGDPVLMQLAKVLPIRALRNNFMPVLEKAAVAPLNPRYDIAETLRTTCSAPNLQNIPRKGGVRDCFAPRPGMLFCSTDYATLELRTLAQSCLDLGIPSEMAKALQAGKDLHLDLATVALGAPYEELQRRLKSGTPEEKKATKAVRDLKKGSNFGFPGGMGADGLVSYVRGMGLDITLHMAREEHAFWKRRWTEMPAYFAHAQRCSDQGGVTHPRTGIPRGGVSFTQAANHFFQHLAGVGAKRAFYNLQRACWHETNSPLYGSRMVAFIHDESLGELPEDRAHEAATEMSRIMIDTMREVTPDIPVEAPPALMRRWLKAAEPVYVNGRLVPWESAA